MSALVLVAVVHSIASPYMASLLFLPAQGRIRKMFMVGAGQLPLDVCRRCEAQETSDTVAVGLDRHVEGERVSRELPHHYWKQVE